MILKEAFRYQNYLGSLITVGLSYLDLNEYVYKTKQEHLRESVNAEASDESKIVDNNLDFSVPVNNLISFIVDAIEEKEKLSKAITEAKKQTEIDVDASISLNKIKQEYLKTLRKLSGLKSKEIEKEGSAYKFDVDGKQVPYFYPIKEVKTIDYDRTMVRKLVQKYQKETDAVSNQREQIELTTEVHYTPKWDIETPLEEILCNE